MEVNTSIEVVGNVTYSGLSAAEVGELMTKYDKWFTHNNDYDAFEAPIIKAETKIVCEDWEDPTGTYSFTIKTHLYGTYLDKAEWALNNIKDDFDHILNPEKYDDEDDE